MSDGRIMFEFERADLAKVAKLVYDRKLTNTAGGNISIRVKDENGKPYLIMTPTMMSEAYLGNLTAEQILVIEPESRKIVSGVGNLTREINMHEAVYDVNPEIQCVFHSHAPNALFWATSNMPMPNLTEATQKVKGIETLAFEPNCSEPLAELVSKHVATLGEAAYAHMYLLNSHGVLITSRADNPVAALHKALAMADTIETNAKIAYQQTVLQALGVMDGYYSKGLKVGTLEDLKAHKAIWNDKYVAEKDGD